MDNQLGGPTPNQQPDPMQTTPSPASSATIPQQPTQAAPQTVVQQVPVVPPHVAKLAAFGQAFQTLAGNSSTYSVDPSTGQTVQTEQKQAPGQLWRNVIASAIMGGASAQAAHNQNPNMGFGGGAVTGGAAGIQDARQQDILKRQQAQQQFKNEQDAAKNNREQDEAGQRAQLFKAQIAQSNAETLRINQQIQGQSFQLHQDVATAGKAAVQSYVDSHIQPVADNIPESEQAQYWKDHPGSVGLDWVHTGTKVGLDANGQPTFESTLSAYDPKGPVTVAKETVDQWKKDGVFDRHPEYEAQVKAGKTVPAQAFVALKSEAEKVEADNLAKTKDTQDSALTTARINHENAATAHELAETSHTREQISTDALGKKTSEQLEHALQDLNTAGGDFSKMPPSSRLVIAESTSKIVTGLNAQYSNILKDDSNPNQQADAGEVLKQIQGYNSLGLQALTSMTPKAPAAQAPNFVGANGVQYSIPPDQLEAFKTAHPEARPIGQPAPPAKSVWDPNKTAPLKAGAKAIGNALSTIGTGPVI